MSAPFMITGLPRSRTAWWAIAATTPLSICHHEPTRHVGPDPMAIHALWNDPRFLYVGISDSSLSLHLERILSTIRPQTLIIERDPGDVLKSLHQVFGNTALDWTKGTAWLQRCQAEINRYRRHPAVKTVPFEALKSYDVVSECWAWLMPNNPHRCPPALMEMNVQVDRSQMLAALRSVA